ncbi:AMP-binding protein [Alishewanella sp. HL-SH06]|uniref:AMP-binding protein n=1 Tax=Alishewanella sp. HL-SH06 TaxID=3461144 RepID=UPI004042577A
MLNTVPVSHAQLLQFADRIALDDGEQQLSYHELALQVSILSAWLVASPYQRIAISGDNSIAWVIADLALAQANKIAIPVPVFFSVQQQQFMLAEAGVELVLQTQATEQSQPTVIDGLWAKRLNPVEHHATSMPISSGKITFTSGTTSTPKGVCLSWKQQAATCDGLQQALAEQFSGAPQLHYCLLPLATLLENVAGVYLPLRLGQRVLILSAAKTGLAGSSGLDLPTFIASLLQYRPASLILTPQLLQALLLICRQHPELSRTFRFIAVGGAHCAKALLTQAAALKLPIFQGYGLSEAGSVVALNLPQQQRQNSVGKPLPHVAVRVRQQHIEVNGQLFSGYLGEMPRDPEAWLDTGDLGYLDEDGYLVIQGRSKHLLISSYGRNISPEWLEAELQSCPAIAQAMVLGDAKPWLSVVLTLRANASKQTLQQQLSQLNTQLPDYARLRTVLVINTPFTQANQQLTANGRLRRQPIIEQYQTAIEQLYQQQPDPLIPTIMAVAAKEELTYEFF